MVRRREPCIRSYETVQLTVLGDKGYSIAGHAIQLSAHGMRLVLDEPIPVAATVKVAGIDWMSLGEVCYCIQERSHYAVGLRLDQALVGLEELAARNRKWSEENPLLGLDETEQLLA